MTDTPPAARPARSPLPRVSLAAAAGAALVAGLVGYAAGQSRGNGNGTTSTSSSACAAAQQAGTRQMATVNADPTNAAQTRTLANLIIQNPGCFDPGTLAGAQTLIDQLNQGAAADAARNAVCAASSEPWWKC